MFKYSAILLAALASLPNLLHAESAEGDSSPATKDEIVVTGVRDRLYESGTLLDVIQKTEVVDDSLIKSMHAVNLVEAISNSPGVRVSNECSMCGVKRVMLNGMRGEHTTILTDGIPFHTMISGYYALDALATTGVERIEVARGAGASLLAPEAIGGAINIISKEPEETGLLLNLSGGESDRYSLGAMGGYVSEDDSTRVSLVIQDDSFDQVDEDDNGVSESPLLESTNYIGRISWDVSDKDNIVFRAAYTESEIFGGPQDGNIGRSLQSLEDDPTPDDPVPLFDGDDVRENWIGSDWRTTEWIKTERTELSLNWLHEFSGAYNLSLTAAWSEHEQDSFYEGFDYANTDRLAFFDVKNNWVLNDDHLLTFGIDIRDEEMRSDSEAGESSLDYVEDSFDYEVLGVYLQDTWDVNDQIELSIAVRIDSIEADFVAEEKPGTEIDETVIAPRADLRIAHNDQWTSRISAGRGYRAPLSFFETDHGILDAGDGFAIDVDELEESLSTTYALSYEGEKLNTTVSIAWTEVENLAALDETPLGVPLLTQLDEDASVVAADIALGYSVNDYLTLGASFETYNYNDAYKSSFAVAPFEERSILSADFHYGEWDWYTSATWTGSRDLSDYGYEGFNVSDPLIIPASPTSPKSTNAESFWTLDMKVTYQVNDSLSLYAGGNNLTDYTQVDDAETPLFWDSEGGYDVAYNYGPLRGREFFFGLEYEI